jgi:transposase
LLLKVRGHPAHETEAAGGQALLAALAQVFPRMALIWVDGGSKRRFAAWGAAELGWRVEAVQHPTAGVRVVWVGPDQEPPPRPRGVRVLKRRWVVERTFAWRGRNRRLSQAYEALPTSEEAWIYAASAEPPPAALGPMTPLSTQALTYVPGHLASISPLCTGTRNFDHKPRRFAHSARFLASSA